MKRNPPSEKGVGLIEVLVSVAILVIALTALYALYSAGLRALSVATKQSVAQTYLNGQVDQLRNCGWATLTLSGSHTLPDAILSNPSSDSNLQMLGPSSGITQTLSVYPVIFSSGSSPYYTVSRAGANARSVSSVSTSIGSQTALNFVFRLQWNSQNRTYSREYASVITQQD